MKLVISSYWMNQKSTFLCLKCFHIKLIYLTNWRLFIIFTFIFKNISLPILFRGFMVWKPAMGFWVTLVLIIFTQKKLKLCTNKVLSKFQIIFLNYVKLLPFCMHFEMLSLKTKLFITLNQKTSEKNFSQKEFYTSCAASLQKNYFLSTSNQSESPCNYAFVSTFFPFCTKSVFFGCHISSTSTKNFFFIQYQRGISCRHKILF